MSQSRKQTVGILLLGVAIGAGGMALVTRSRTTVADSRLGAVDDANRLLDAVTCGKGDKAACNRALETDVRRCDSGDPEGCVLLGITFQTGHRVPKDERRALAYFQRACDASHPNGCWYLGLSYEQARGVPQDYARALAAYEKGCRGTKGYVNACDSLGALYEYGRGVPVDRAKALAAYDDGCKVSTQGFACEHAKRLRARPQ